MCAVRNVLLRLTIGFDYEKIALSDLLGHYKPYGAQILVPVS